MTPPLTEPRSGHVCSVDYLSAKVIVESVTMASGNTRTRLAALPDLARFENPADLLDGRRGKLNRHAPSSRLEDLVAGVRSATSTQTTTERRAPRRRPAAHPRRAEHRGGA
jgi:hypothetical protein